MDEDELSALTVVELKVRLKDLGLTTSGKKSDLIARLIDSEDEGDVFILDDDDGDESVLEPEFNADEIIEAEVFEAEIIEAEEFEDEVIETIAHSIKMSAAPIIKGTPWYKDGTTIATILVVLILAGAGGWWYLSKEASVFQTAPSRYGDDLQFTVSNGLLLADGDDMVAMLRDAVAPSLDDVCGELRIEFDGRGTAYITDGTIGELLDPSDSNLEGAVMAKDAYGRSWNAVQSNLNYDLEADLSGFTWSAINQDTCSSNTDWTRRNNQLDIEVNQWHEITEKGLLRSQSTVDFVDSEGQAVSAQATTFDGIVGSDTVSDMIEVALLPMHPVNLYDIFQLTILSEGLTGEHEGWGWRVGSTGTVGGQDAIQILMHHIEISKCLGRAEMVLWAIPGQPLPARQIVEVSIDKSQTTSDCDFTLKNAIDFAFPDGTFTAQFALEQTAFKRGTELLDWQENYATRPMAGDGMPTTSDRVAWATHMWDNSTIRPFTLEQAVSCVVTDADAFGAASTALNGDGYVFAAQDDRTGSSPVWNLSWVSSIEAGWVRVTWPGGENCLNSGDGQITGDDKPEHARERIPTTHRLSVLENRMVSQSKYPTLHDLITPGSETLRDDVQVGYALVVPDDNAVSDWLDDLDLLEGQVTVILERSWTTLDGMDHTLRVGMDGQNGRMAGWIVTSTPE